MWTSEGRSDETRVQSAKPGNRERLMMGDSTPKSASVPGLYKNYRPNCLTPQKSANIDESESLNESESLAGNFRHYWFQSVLAPFEIIDLERKVIGAGITIGQ